PVHQVGNFFWAWYVKLNSAVSGPGDEVLPIRIAELVRLWNWAVPGLLILSATGWWMGRGNVRIRLLGFSFLSTFFGYLGVIFTQGYGWGARYLHPAWGVLPVLAATALVLVGERERDRLGSYVGTLACLSLMFATLLRAVQIESDVRTHLTHLPPTVPGVRQI